MSSSSSLNLVAVRQSVLLCRWLGLSLLPSGSPVPLFLLPLGADRTQAFVPCCGSSMERPPLPERGPAARLWPMSGCSPPSHPPSELARSTFCTGTSGLRAWEGPPMVFPASPSCSFLPRFSGPWGRGSSPGVTHPGSTLSPRSHPWKGWDVLTGSAAPRLLPQGPVLRPRCCHSVHRAESDGRCSPHRGVCLVPDTGGRHSSQVPWPVALGPTACGLLP